VSLLVSLTSAGAFRYIWLNQKIKPMKTIKLLFLSVILALTSCSKDTDYEGVYEGEVMSWEESTPNDIETANWEISVVNNSQGYLVSGIPLMYGNHYLSKRGVLKWDSISGPLVFTDETGDTIVAPLTNGTFKHKVKIVVSDNNLDLLRQVTIKDSLGNIVEDYHFEGMLDKQ